MLDKTKEEIDKKMNKKSSEMEIVKELLNEYRYLKYQLKRNERLEKGSHIRCHSKALDEFLEDKDLGNVLMYLEDSINYISLGSKNRKKGEKMCELIKCMYITDEALYISDVVERLDISTTMYYKYKKEAMEMLCREFFGFWEEKKAC